MALYVLPPPLSAHTHTQTRAHTRTPRTLHVYLLNSTRNICNHRRDDNGLHLSISHRPPPPPSSSAPRPGDFTNDNGTGGVSIYGSKCGDPTHRLHNRPLCDLLCTLSIRIMSAHEGGRAQCRACPPE